MDQLCRLCGLEYGPNGIDIFLDNDLLLDKLEKYAGLKLEDDEDLPWLSCSRCFNTLQTFHLFVENCHRVQVHLVKEKERLEYAEEEEAALSDVPPSPPTLYRDAQLVHRSSYPESDQESEPPVWQCEECGKELLNKDVLRQHRKYMHTDRKQYICDKCGKSLCDPGSLRKHMQLHGDQTFECEECGKQFKVESTLANHRKFVHAKMQIKCPHCEKTFGTESLLNSHLKVHSDETPYVCNHCGKAFKRKMNLRYHINTHENNRPYPCVRCNKKFKCPSALSRHQKKVHHS